MTKSQIEACRKRNEQLKQDIVDGKVTIAVVTKCTADIDSLLVDLETAIETARVEWAGQQELRTRLSQESSSRANCMRTAALLRDKLTKAKRILDTFDQTTFTPEETMDMKDVGSDG
jgi:hypothetical protein